MSGVYISVQICTICTLVVMVTGQTLQVGWLVPVSSHPTANFPFNASTSIAALALGIETIQNESLLQDYTLNVTMLDSDCSSKQSLGVLTDQLFIQALDVVIGPPCAHVVQAIGELLAYRNIPLINWVSIGQTIDYKIDLDTYIRTMAPVSSLGGIMTLFYYYTGWRRMVIISTDGDDYSAAAETIITNLGYHVVSGFNIVHHYERVRMGITDVEIDRILTNIIYEARVIILLIPREELRTYMLRAYALGMTGGDYQFLYTDPTLADSQDIAVITSDTLWRNDDSYDDQARQAFENVLYFVLGHTTTNQTEWVDLAFAATSRVFGGRTDLPEPLEPDEYAAYLHDTIIMYARVLNKSLSENDTSGGEDLRRWGPYVFFKGLSGDVVMNFIADRQPTFFVYDLNAEGEFHEVANLYYTIEDERVAVNSSFTRIVWGDGTNSDDYIPPDTPTCGFFNEFCPTSSDSDNSVVVIVSVTVSMLVVILILFFLFRWWRYEKELNSMTWKILPCDLNFTISKKLQSSMYLSGRLNRSATSENSSIVQGTFKSMTNMSQGRVSFNRGQIFTTVALFRGEIVAVKKSFRKKIAVERTFMQEMKQVSKLTELKHCNLTNLLGVCTIPENIYAVWEYCNKGSLQDVIENDDIRLDTMFKLSIAVDICQGLEYIHKSAVKQHGNLKSSNCVIDSRWVCKLTDFGLQKLKTPLHLQVEEIGEHAAYARLFWTAPEVLRFLLQKQPFKHTQAGDIYAVGIIIKELVCRNEPYCDSSDLSPKEIITKVADKEEDELAFRPEISDTDMDSDYHQTNMACLIRRCWSEEPEDRPSVKAVLRTLNKINPYKKTSVVDNMIAMMERYTNNLEDIVAERTEQLEEEKRKTDALLYRMLPKKVADNLKFGHSVEAEAFDSVTIYFSDIVQFTDLAGQSTPLQIVALLNSLYTLFDDIISHYDVYKVETIGDAYMIVSGLPERNDNLHVREIANVALNILQSVLTFKIPHKPDQQLQIRIGLHTGSVVAGVVGLTMPRYCLFGDTVNTASRMESNGKPLKIHISTSTYEAITEFPSFIIEDRGEIPIKGKGMMRTYWLVGSDDASKEKNLTNTDKDKAISMNSIDNVIVTDKEEQQERNVKDSGVSMTLDNDVTDETEDKETQELRHTLKELHKQSPNQALQASNTGIVSTQKNSAERSVILIDNSSKTKNQEEDKHDELGTVNQTEMDVNPIGIFKKVTTDPVVDIESAGQILSNDQHKLGSETDACLQNTAQESGLGQIYFQESNGSKTLEIYNNAELRKSISNTPARKGIMKTSS